RVSQNQIDASVFHPCEVAAVTVQDDSAVAGRNAGRAERPGTNEATVKVGYGRFAGELDGPLHLADGVRESTASRAVKPRVDLDWARDVAVRTDGEQRGQTPPAEGVVRQHAVRGQVVAERQGEGVTLPALRTS